MKKTKCWIDRTLIVFKEARGNRVLIITRGEKKLVDFGKCYSRFVEDYINEYCLANAPEMFE